MFGIILNDKIYLCYLIFFWTCFIWTVAEQKSTLLSFLCILNQWKRNQTKKYSEKLSEEIKWKEELLMQSICVCQ